MAMIVQVTMTEAYTAPHYFFFFFFPLITSLGRVNDVSKCGQCWDLMVKLNEYIYMYFNLCAK